jgi:hypothetical protein
MTLKQRQMQRHRAWIKCEANPACKLLFRGELLFLKPEEKLIRNASAYTVEFHSYGGDAGG